MIPKILLSLLFFTSPLWAGDKPNILWITSEDNDKFWLGCYGNEQAQTPYLDALAERSVRFENFYSNAPVCAVARSTILNGVYAPSQGTQHMRSRHPIPATHKPYVHYLREAGYYCTNASKTDYNFQGNDRKIWDECHGEAHYRNRKKGQPFFAIFNLTISHESSLFADNIATRRKNGLLPETPRIDPADVQLRPYLPDLPEVRSDIAIYHDTITLLDKRIGAILAELDTRGLAEDTIIFYYSDHGGVTPRGKRYLHDTGVNVPLLVHVPEKWQQLSPFENGSITQETAAFVDLAPTLLSLLGQAKPEPMQGRAFLGDQREEPQKEDYVFLFADRFDEFYGMRRGLTDGRWKYIRRFTPHYSAAPYSYYQFSQKAWEAWRKAWQAGELDQQFTAMWQPNQPVEELFDTDADPWEIKNLASDPAHREQLLTMRSALKDQMKSILDTGLVPEPMFAEVSPGKPIADYVASRSEQWPELVELAFQATARDDKNLTALLAKLSSPSGLERYWAIQGLLILGEHAQAGGWGLMQALQDEHSANRTAAAQVLYLLGQEDAALPVLLQELSKSENEYAQQNAVNVFTQLDLLEKVPDSWILKHRKNKQAGSYIRRLAQKLSEERGL